MRSSLLKSTHRQLCLLRCRPLPSSLSCQRSIQPSLFQSRRLQTGTEIESDQQSGPNALSMASRSSSSSSSPSRPTLPTTSRSTKTKQVLTLTPKAIRQLEELLNSTNSDNLPGRLVRVGVRQKGCAGMAYDLSYVSSPGKFDEIVTGQTESGKEVMVIIDSRALLTIIGSTMDYEESSLGSRFIFQNPNVKEQCGCGESFMV
ncbi:hypothetical protein DFH28DRAFT_235175 [Melampsora americana]|nr:hypothetical protein DFH28DRAFT_235175 [Melampsora americana]